METKDKLQALRAKMQAENIAMVLVPTADPHMSEYISPCFQTRAWLSGFTGSAATLVVGLREAKLWTDGRYFIQAEQELAGSGIDLMKLNTPGYPSLLEYLQAELQEQDKLAVNFAVYSQASLEQLAENLEGQAVEIVDRQLVEEIWAERPGLPKKEIYDLPVQYAGKTREEKISDLREHLTKQGVEAQFLASLDDIAWLFNIRGGDIAHTPVPLAYAYIDQETAVLFVEESKVPATLTFDFAEAKLNLLPYSQVEEFLGQITVSSMLLDKRRVNARVYRAIPETVNLINQPDFTTQEKAQKNEVEIANQKIAYLKDGVAMTKLIYWLKNHPQIEEVDELEVAQKLFSIRQEIPGFIEESFTTIAAYGPNAAMMHYSASKEQKANLAAAGFMLVDAGSQFWEGTTDTTRTIVLGELSEQQIRHYTLTLKGHINLASAKFLKGSTGHYLDILARQPLWQEHIDFKSGTGHGIGYLLNVHEGPQSISRAPLNVPLELGMIVSNEPGVYLEDQYGIRLENVHVVVESGAFLGDEFYKFEVLTRVPFDPEAIDPSLLTFEQRDLYNKYQAMVLADLSPYLTEEERAWLTEECRPLA